MRFILLKDNAKKFAEMGVPLFSYSMSSIQYAKHFKYLRYFCKYQGILKMFCILDASFF